MAYIKKKSLGRISNLGGHFDIRSDSFLGTTNIFKESLPIEKIQSQDTPNLDFKYSVSSSSKEKFKSLEVDADLKLSILFGLIEVNGAASYLKEDDSDKKIVKGSLIYKLETVTESININLVKPLIDCDSLQNEQSTHVVTSIKYGANAIITFEKNYSNEANKLELSGSLGAVMKKLGAGGSVNIDGTGSIELEDHEKKLLDEFTIKFTGDLIPKSEEIPNSVESALEIMKKIPIYVNSTNSGKGIPIEYGLVPIESIQKSLSVESSLTRIYKSIGEDTIESIESEFEKLAASQLELKEFQVELSEYRDYFNSSQLNPINEFISQVKVQDKTFKKSVSELIVSVRSGINAMSTLNDCIYNYLQSEFSSNGLHKFLESQDQTNIKNQLSFIKYIKSKDIKIISKTMNKDQILNLPNDNCKYYILNYFNSTRNGEHWSSIYDSTFMAKFNEKRTNEKFAIIDLEIHSITSSALSTHPTTTNNIIDKVPFIELYINQKLKQSHFQINPFSNFAEFTKIGFDFNGVAPTDTPLLKLKCPGEECKKQPKEWKCLICDDDLKYIYESKKCYCICGSYPITKCTFKCSEVEHGNDYISLPSNVCEQLKYLPPRPLTLLLLGETGVGKSTFINSLVNYVTYNSMKDAINGNDIKVVIPIKFTMVTKDGVEKEVSIGAQTDDEFLLVGKSSTQTCQTYKFQESNLTIIDTPGIGDPRGVDQDQLNLDHILQYISRFETIDGICILLKPNEAKEHVLSKYCFKGLLSQLNKNASKNIVFCYTNSRSTFYQPGDSHTKIQTMVKELNVPDLKYELNSNTFCFDSESFRFLAALKQKIQFEDKHIKDFSSSWEHSVNSTNNLISYLNLLPSHNIKNSTSLNETRRLIYTLARPIVEITGMIENKVNIIKAKKLEIENDNSDLESLKKKLTFEYDDIGRRELDEPTTVCTNHGCVEIIGLTGKETIHYAQRCHVGCTIKGPTNTVNSIGLKGCNAMGGLFIKSDYCKRCENPSGKPCHYTSHMHITYETYPVKRKLENEIIKNQIKNATTSVQLKASSIKELQKEIDANNKEKEEIIAISSKLSFFLKENSITGYVDTVIEYLKLQIKTEDYKSDKSNKNALETNLKMFEQQNEILQKQAHCSELITVDQVPKLVEKLIKLPINGQTIKYNFEMNELAQSKLSYKPVVISKSGKHTVLNDHQSKEICNSGSSNSHIELTSTTTKTITTGSKSFTTLEEINENENETLYGKFISFASKMFFGQD